MPNPTTLADSSGNGRTLTADTSGALVFGTVGPWGSAPNFAVQRNNDGSSGQLQGEIGTRHGDAGLVVSTLTISSWVRWTTPPFNVQLIVGVQRSDGTLPLGERFRITVETGLSNQLSFLNTAGRILSEGGVSANTWHHVAFTWDGVTSILYLDGTALPTTSSTGPDTAANGNTFGIGGFPTSPSPWFGRMAGAAYFGAALSATRVAAHAAATSSAATYKSTVLADSPLGLWMLDELPLISTGGQGIGGPLQLTFRSV